MRADSRRAAGVETALGDAEEQLAVARVRRPASLGPAMRALGRLSRRAGGGAVRDRVVEAHEHVGAEPRLVAHRVLGCDAQPRAVVRRDEGRAVVVDRRDLGEADQLVAAAVGEDRMVPAHERVEPAGALDEVDPGTQREVIRVAEQDVDAGRAHLVGMRAP